jgi:histidinol phosphatase-like PHP family hydrolase
MAVLLRTGVNISIAAALQLAPLMLSHNMTGEFGSGVTRKEDKRKDHIEYIEENSSAVEMNSKRPTLQIILTHICTCNRT